MPDTLANINVRSDAWTDAYTDTGITVGVQVIVTVKSGSIIAAVKATAPTSADGEIHYKMGEQFLNKTGDSGLWLRSTSDLAVVNVSEY